MSLREVLIGKPRDPLDPSTRHNIALIAFFAWVGLGADGLSSSCYGPEEAFLQLGEHRALGIFLAIATAVTVFIIALAYNQVIELFPNGGGGYKVATSLLGPRAGLMSGAALIVDYVLTIAISIASGVDAFFSLLPVEWQSFKLTTEVFLILILLGLNLRGMKESIAVLLPIFMGFFLTHALLIGYGVYVHAGGLLELVPEAGRTTDSLSASMGFIFVASLMLRAYSLGGGTYTGIEAVSNNIHVLAEPRVRTGKITMLYMALSLAFTAGGIIVLYLLWNAQPTTGRTLNAVVFDSIIRHSGVSGVTGDVAIAAVLAFEAGLLLVAANTGFLGGPAVLANMAADSWVPRHFRELSSRLVTDNGIVLFGGAALVILLWSGGRVGLLVVLYSINVFLTFSLSLLGLTVHWWRRRIERGPWKRRLALSVVGLAVSSGILSISLVEKFSEGAWETVLITSAVIAICFSIRRHYDAARAELQKTDALFEVKVPWDDTRPVPAIDPAAPTAVVVVGKHRGVGVHALLWVQRMFPGHFKNFVFLSVGEVDAQSYGGEGTLRTLRYAIENSLHFFARYCHSHGLAAEYYIGFGTEPVDEFLKLADQVFAKYPHAICFASKLIFAHATIFTRWLHNSTPQDLQERLHLQGKQMVLLPMKVE
jgi:amino acid transporter